MLKNLALPIFLQARAKEWLFHRKAKALGTGLGVREVLGQSENTRRFSLTF